MELTTQDRARLDVLERTITDNADAFWALCTALAEIRHNRLYKGTHRHFSVYCVEILGFSASRARYFAALTGVKVAKPQAAAAEPGELVVPEGIELRNAHRAELARVPAPNRQATLMRAVTYAERAMSNDATVPRLTAKIIRAAAGAVADQSAARAAAEQYDSADLVPDEAEPDTPEQAFADRPLWTAIQSQLSAIKRELEKLSKRTSARFMPLDPLVAGLRQVHAQLRHGVPHCWCYDCGGGLAEREDCGTCKGLGFNTLTMLKQATKEQQTSAQLWNSATIS